MTGQKYDSSFHDDWLKDSHLRLQRFVLIVVAPVSIIFFFLLAIFDLCWQNIVVFFSFAAAASTWFLSLYYTKRGRLEASITILIVSILAFLTIAMLLIQGVAATSIMAALAVIIYSSMFSFKFLYLSAGITLVSFLSGEIVRFCALYQMKIFTPLQRLLFECAFALLLLPVVVIFLRGGRRMNEGLITAMSEVNNELKSVIDIASGVGRVLEEVVQQIKDISGAFADQAGEQTAAIREVSSAMGHVREISRTTASSAFETQSASQKLHQRTVDGSLQLKRIEQGFRSIIESTESSKVEFKDLALRAGKIEDVLAANREIAAQIKILAINAAIQAAKAGEYGSGFRVVAKELKAMIQHTDESLDQSRQLLEDIRNRAQQSAETIEISVDLLHDQFLELNRTGDLVEEITESFMVIASRFDKISGSAKDQQARLDDIASGINYIDTAAEELSTATEILLESVDRILESNDNLKEVLSAQQLQ